MTLYGNISVFAPAPPVCHSLPKHTHTHTHTYAHTQLVIIPLPVSVMITLNLWVLQGILKEFIPKITPFSSVTQSCPALCDPTDCSTPGLPVHHQLPEFIQTHVHWVGDAIQPSHPLLAPYPAFNLSQHQGLFKNSFLHIRWAKYWSFSFSISPSNEYSGLISFRMDWLALLAVHS